MNAGAPRRWLCLALAAAAAAGCSRLEQVGQPPAFTPPGAPERPAPPPTARRLALAAPPPTAPAPMPMIAAAGNTNSFPYFFQNTATAS